MIQIGLAPDKWRLWWWCCRDQDKTWGQFTVWSEWDFKKQAGPGASSLLLQGTLLQRPPIRCIYFKVSYNVYLFPIVPPPLFTIWVSSFIQPLTGICSTIHAGGRVALIGPLCSVLVPAWLWPWVVLSWSWSRQPWLHHCSRGGRVAVIKTKLAC